MALDNAILEESDGQWEAGGGRGGRKDNLFTGEYSKQ